MSLAFRRFVEEQGIAPEDYPEVARDFVRTVCVDDRAQQHDKESSDINVIMRRNLAQGILPQTRQIPIFADISEVGSLQEAMAIMDDAQRVFRALDAETREAFGNDPRRFVAAAQDPAAVPLFEKLGLTMKKAAPPEDGGAAPAQ